MRVIGGLPRELMLAHLHGHALPEALLQDMDIVMESDARAVGRDLQQRWGGTLRIHDDFQTAVWCAPTVGNLALSMDLITARSEMYPQPGALPVTTPSTFVDDVARRDFAINTLALDLASCLALTTGRPAVQIHHHPQALADLEQGLVRILHDASFRDDPTRIFRAVRYAERYGYQIEPHTLALLQQSLVAADLDTLSPIRICHEIQHIFQETQMPAILQRLMELEVLSRLGIQTTNWLDICTASRRVAWHSRDREAALWILLMFQSDDWIIRKRLQLPRQTMANIEQFRYLIRHHAVVCLKHLKPSQVVQLLDGYSGAVLQALVAWRPELQTTVERYRSVWRDMRPVLNGHDLRALGYVPGPPMGQVLRHLRDACLDGLSVTRQDALERVRQLLGDPPGSAAP